MSTQHDFIQGEPDWLAFRLQHFGASEAAAMLGISKRTTRNELLRAKATGLPREFSDWVVENLLEPGHVAEALARPLAEEVVGEDLFPVTMSKDRLSASTDGLSMANNIAWESKQWNEESAAAVRAGRVPDEHMPQCQQVLMVTEAEKLLFTVTDGTRERFVFVWVYPDPAWFERLRAGWEQFDVDLALWVPPPVTTVVVAQPVKALTSVVVYVEGQISVSHNFEAVEKSVRDFLDNRLIRKPQTDQDFADLAEQIDAMKQAEANLDSAEEQMIAQVEPVDAAKKLKDMLHKLVRDNRLMAEKLLESEKLRRKTEIVTKGQQDLDEHVEALNKRLGTAWIPRHVGDFAAAIKNKRTIESLQNAADTTLANEKIAASALADRLAANRKLLVVEEVDYFFLFADFQQQGAKDSADFSAIVAQRVQQHKDAEEKRKQAQAVVQPAAAPAQAAMSTGVSGLGLAPRRAPPAAEPKRDDQPPFNTGALNARIGPGITVNVEAIKSFGIQPVPVPGAKAAVYWAEADYPKILAALVERLQDLYEKAVAP